MKVGNAKTKEKLRMRMGMGDGEMGDMVVLRTSNRIAKVGNV